MWNGRSFICIINRRGLYLVLIPVPGAPVQADVLIEAYWLGGWGGLLPPPPQFWATQIFGGSKRKFGQSQFLETFPCFIIIIIIIIIIISLKRQIFSILIWKKSSCRRNNPVTFCRDSGYLAREEFLVIQWRVSFVDLHIYSFLLLSTVLHCTDWNGLFPVVNWLE